MKNTLGILAFTCLMFACTAKETPYVDAEPKANDETEVVVFGAGCFWCVEAVFQELKGVYAVESGYSNGLSDGKPSYKEVCTGRTGYVEVAKITFNPNEVSYETLLSVFFQTHDPTTLNAQGADKGTQYRSGVFYTTEEQKQVAEKVIAELNAAGAYPKPIVTEVTALTRYFKAENYHQDYYFNNPNQGYCSYVIQPKLEKFRAVFKDHLKVNGFKFFFWQHSCTILVAFSSIQRKNR